MAPPSTASANRCLVGAHACARPAASFGDVPPPSPALARSPSSRRLPPNTTRASHELSLSFPSPPAAVKHETWPTYIPGPCVDRPRSTVSSAHNHRRFLRLSIRRPSLSTFTTSDLARCFSPPSPLRFQAPQQHPRLTHDHPHSWTPYHTPRSLTHYLSLPVRPLSYFVASRWCFDGWCLSWFSALYGGQWVQRRCSGWGHER